MEKKNKMSVIAIIAIAVSVIGSIFSGVVIHEKNSKISELTETLQKEIAKVPEPIIKEVKVEVPIEKIVTETVEVVKVVDSPYLNKTLDFIENNVDEDVTLDYIVFETDAINEAENYIKQNMVELLDDNDFFEDGSALEDFRKSEVSVKKVSDYVIEDRDFDDKDLTLSYEVKIRAKEDDEDSIIKDFKVTIPFENKEMISEDIEVELI